MRVFDTKAGAFVDFEVMLASVAKADVIFVGEQHDDPNTHRLEAAILEGLDRRKVRPVVSLEMFERDVQAALDGYLSGALVEEEMVKTSRPWPQIRDRLPPTDRGSQSNADGLSSRQTCRDALRRLSQNQARRRSRN